MAKRAWVRCPMCEDFWCNIHAMHVYDCDCPPIEEWTEDPYSGGVGPKQRTRATASVPRGRQKTETRKKT